MNPSPLLSSLNLPPSLAQSLCSISIAAGLLIASSNFTGLRAQASSSPPDAPAAPDASASELESPEISTTGNSPSESSPSPDHQTPSSKQDADSQPPAENGQETDAPEPEKPAIPEDVYWTSKRVSVPIEGGLIGLPAGSEVRILKRDDAKWTATNGRDMFQIDSYILMKDPATAAALRAEESNAEVLSRAAASAARQAARERELEERKRHSEALKEPDVRKGGLTGATRLSEPSKR